MGITPGVFSQDIIEAEDSDYKPMLVTTNRGEKYELCFIALKTLNFYWH